MQVVKTPQSGGGVMSWDDTRRRYALHIDKCDEELQKIGISVARLARSHSHDVSIFSQTSTVKLHSDCNVMSLSICPAYHVTSSFRDLITRLVSKHHLLKAKSNADNCSLFAHFTRCVLP